LGGYLGLLTLAALAADRRGPPGGVRRTRFALLVPAQNEEALIGRLVESLAAQDYPRDRVQVCVVADNCTDRTAERAAAAGARVYQRDDPSLRGKGHALHWLLNRLQAEREAGSGLDAYVVLDADSVVDPCYLARMDARLQAGARAIQPYYGVLNPGDSPVAAIRHAALAAIHYVRPLGRSALGLSAGLKGNGMCFAAVLLEGTSWQWYTLAEDVELHLALVRQGVRVAFAPETWVRAEMPVTLEQAASQNARWERGRLDMARGPALRLLWDAARRRSPLRADAALEQLIPPLSVPFALSGLLFAGSLLARAWLPAALLAASLAGQLGQLVAGLALVGAPPHAYRALAFAPVYVGWKVLLYLRSLVTAPTTWVRTTRT
jgi:cellulose synthase/poly-beta-1,6-N-acetylglucosamine synthase-like glycosyltransferase